MFLNLNLPSSRNHQIYFEGRGIGISENVIVWMHMHVNHSITWCCGYVHRLNNVITTLILLLEQAQINRRFDDLQGRKISSHSSMQLTKFWTAEQQPCPEKHLPTWTYDTQSTLGVVANVDLAPDSSSFQPAKTKTTAIWHQCLVLVNTLGIWTNIVSTSITWGWSLLWTGDQVDR